MNQRKTNEKTPPLRHADLKAGALAALAGFAAVAVYVSQGPNDNAVDGAAAPVAVVSGSAGASAPDAAKSTGDAQKSAGHSGRLAAFVRKKAPEELPKIEFTDAAGTPRTLADFRGKTVLLNLWATWCAPCREEMPSLDRLQKALGSDKFEVVTLALERGGVVSAQKFFDEIKVVNLKLYVDQSTRAANALRALGMPTTILIDPEGREIGRLSGPAAWDGDDAKALVSAAMQ